jgi:hypothetical protein
MENILRVDRARMREFSWGVRLYILGRMLMVELITSSTKYILIEVITFIFITIATTWIILEILVYDDIQLYEEKVCIVPT